jgi:hypothetical protein
MIITSIHLFRFSVWLYTVSWNWFSSHFLSAERATFLSLPQWFKPLFIRAIRCNAGSLALHSPRKVVPVSGVLGLQQCLLLSPQLHSFLVTADIDQILSRGSVGFAACVLSARNLNGTYRLQVRKLEHVRDFKQLHFDLSTSAFTNLIPASCTKCSAFKMRFLICMPAWQNNASFRLIYFSRKHTKHFTPSFKGFGSPLIHFDYLWEISPNLITFRAFYFQNC